MGAPNTDIAVIRMTNDPELPTVGDNITFTATVKNKGNVSVGSSKLMFKVGGETPGTPRTLYTVPRLDPGETFTVARTSVLSAKSYRNTAIADYDESIDETNINTGESNESNNVLTADFRVYAAGQLPIDNTPPHVLHDHNHIQPQWLVRITGGFISGNEYQELEAYIEESDSTIRWGRNKNAYWTPEFVDELDWTSGFYLKSNGKYITDSTQDVDGLGQALVAENSLNYAVIFDYVETSENFTLQIRSHMDGMVLSGTSNANLASFTLREESNSSSLWQHLEPRHFFPLPPGTLDDMVDASDSLKSGDQMAISAVNRKYLKLDGSKVVKSTAGELNATKFLVEKQTQGFLLSYNGKYIRSRPDNVLVCDASKADALTLFVHISRSHSIFFATSDNRHWLTNINDNSVTLVDADGITDDCLYSYHLESISYTSHDSGNYFTACETSMASLVFHVTGGLFLALGLGPYINEGEVAPGIYGLVRNNARVMAALNPIIETVNTNRGSVATLLSLVVIDIWELFEILHQEDLLMDLVRFLLKSVGWWLIGYVIAKILELVFLPEEEATRLLASATVWGGQLIVSVENVSEACGR